MARFRSKARKPLLVMALARAIFMTFLMMLLSFALSLLLAITVLLIVAASKGSHVDMAFAYRHIAAPVALVVGIIVLVLSLIMELRHHRQTKALRSVERAG
jgi:ABC-type dipeptide/oligopeptide/nickel transport system permease component